MILTMTTMFEMRGGRYSILSSNDSRRWWIMERCWDFNQRNVSCVPRDEYDLVKHNTEKYPHTWCVIGDGVSHWEEPGIPRYACVFHEAISPSDLEGCFAPALSITQFGDTVESEQATKDLLYYLSLVDEPIRVLCQ